jgi:hypothetical protein
MLCFEGKDVAVVTDVHLGYSKSDRLHVLRDLLVSWTADQTEVVLGGDLLDVQRAWDRDVLADGSLLWGPLQDLATAGRLHVIPGNHDYRLRKIIFDGMAFGAWSSACDAVDFASDLRLAPGNTFHRYFAFRKCGQTWLVCHGDEADFGAVAKKAVGSGWRLALDVVYGVEDQRDPNLIRAIENAALTREYTKALYYGLRWLLDKLAGRGVVRFSAAESLVGQGLVGSDIVQSTADAGLDFATELAAGVAAHYSAEKADAGGRGFVAAGTSPAERDLAWLLGDDREETPGFRADVAPAKPKPDLHDVPGLLTAPDASWDKPGVVAGEYPPTNYVIGHRHYDEMVRVGDSWVIDCGSWEQASCREPRYLWLDDSGPRLMPEGVNP